MAESQKIEIELSAEAKATINELKSAREQSKKSDRERVALAKKELDIKKKLAKKSSRKDISKLKDGSAESKKARNQLKKTGNEVDKVAKKAKKAAKEIAKTADKVENRFKSSIKTFGRGMAELPKKASKAIQSGVSKGFSSAFNKKNFAKWGKRGALAAGGGILGAGFAVANKGMSMYDMGIEGLSTISEQQARFGGMLGADPKKKQNLELIKEEIDKLNDVERGGISRDKATKWFADILEVYKAALGNRYSNADMIKEVGKMMQIGIDVSAEQNRDIEYSFQAMQNMITSGREMVNRMALGSQQLISQEKAREIFVRDFRKAGAFAEGANSDDAKFRFSKKDYDKLDVASKVALLKKADVEILKEKGKRSEGAAARETATVKKVDGLLIAAQNAKTKQERDALIKKAKDLQGSTAVSESLRENIMMEAAMKGVDKGGGLTTQVGIDAARARYYSDLMNNPEKFAKFAEGMVTIGAAKGRTLALGDKLSADGVGHLSTMVEVSKDAFAVGKKTLNAMQQSVKEIANGNILNGFRAIMGNSGNN